MQDLNRDFQFYINHPDKVQKILRLKKRLDSKTCQRSFYEPQQNMYDCEKENYTRHNDGMGGYGLSKNSRNIKKISQIPIKSGHMDYGDRKKLLKNLF